MTSLLDYPLDPIKVLRILNLTKSKSAIQMLQNMLPVGYYKIMEVSHKRLNIYETEYGKKPSGI